MKKTLAFILAAATLVLCLTGCKPEENEVTPPAETPVMETPSASPVSQAPVSSVEPTAPIVADGVVIPSPGLAMDAFDLGEKYERWYPETTLEVIPRGDYGELLPFIGGQNRGEWGDTEYYYGLCTKDGKIVCDPVFIDYETYSFDGSSVYFLRYSLGEKSDYGKVRSNTVVMATDGHFAQEYEEVRDGGEGTITVQNNGKWGSIDFFGNEIIPCMYQFPLYFGDDLAAVTTDFEKGYKYIDRENVTVIDNLPPIPYEFVETKIIDSIEDAFMSTFWNLRFSCGRALVFHGQSYGYINRDGEEILTYSYESSWAFQHGRMFSGDRAIVCDGDDYAVIDTEGNVIIPFSSRYIYNIIYSGDEPAFAVGESSYYDKDGRLIFSRTGWNHALSYEGNGIFSRNTYDEKQGWKYISVIKNGIEIPIPVCRSIIVLNDDLFLIWFESTHTPDWLIDGSGNFISEVQLEGENYCYQYLSTSEGKYIVFSKSAWEYTEYPDSSEPVDFSGEFVENLDFYEYRYFDEYFTGTYGDYCGLIDKYGNWVIKLSMLDNID